MLDQLGRTVSHMNSFFVKTARAWNNLPVYSSLLVSSPVTGYMSLINYALGIDSET